MTDEGRTKSYPENYPADAMAILDAMSFTEGRGVKLLGSMSIRSQQYAGDYDAYEVVDRKGSKEAVLDKLTTEFQSILKNLRGMTNVFIGDIKSGCVEDWRVIPKNAGVTNNKVVGYNSVSAKKKLDELRKADIITEGEQKEAEALLDGATTPAKFLLARKKIKFHIVRWTVPEVLAGAQTLRDGRRFTIQDAFSSPTITKLDTIGLVQNNKYTDFSMIYEFKADGKVLNPSFEDVGKSLKEDIVAYKAEGNPFKVIKREFALAKYLGNSRMLKSLTPVLNSDLGRIYSLRSDVATLITLLEEHAKVPLERIRYEIDQFKSRMANIYSLPDFLKTEHTLLGHIASALKTSSKPQLLNHLKQIEALLQSSLTHNTKKLRGGRIDVHRDIDEVNAQRGWRAKQHTARNVMSMLRQAAHATTNLDPAASLGFRVLADQIYAQIPTFEHGPDGKPKPEDVMNLGHQQAQHFQEKKIINGDLIPPEGPHARTIPIMGIRPYFETTVHPRMVRVMADPKMSAEVARIQALRYPRPPHALRFTNWEQQAGKILEDNPFYFG